MFNTPLTFVHYSNDSNLLTHTQEALAKVHCALLRCLEIQQHLPAMSTLHSLYQFSGLSYQEMMPLLYQLTNHLLSSKSYLKQLEK